MRTNIAGRDLKAWVAGLGMTVASMGAAQAQQVGTYEGSTEDGHFVQIQVEQDRITGKYVVDVAYSNMTLLCPKTNTIFETGIVAFNYDPPINDDGLAVLTVKSWSDYMSFYMHFHANDTVTGRVRGAIAQFADDWVPPRSGQSCSDKYQKFKAKFVSDQALVKPMTAPVQVTARIDSEGHQVIERSSER